METRQIEYFLRIAELGSINKAADDLRMSQPSLSRLISQLEHEIGTALFMRTRRGVHLTDAGQLLAERARPILRDLFKLRDEVGQRGLNQFNIALPFAFHRMVTLPFAELILRQMPETKLRIFEGVNHSIRHWIELGTVDAAVTAATESTPSTFSASPLLQEQLVLVGSRAAGLRLNTPVPLSSLGATRLIMPSRPNVISAFVENAVRRRGYQYKTVLEAETLSLCIELCKRGLGFTVMTYSAICAQLDELSAAPIKTLSLTWSLYVNQARAYTPSTQSMIRLFATHVDDTIKSGGWQFARSLRDGTAEPRKPLRLSTNGRH
jgi:LysR family transcriptional regulator, nitrogen assimilation regulatory protein